jgi:hypothetical protein
VDRNSAPAPQLGQALLLAALLRQAQGLPPVVRALPAELSWVQREAGAPS